MKAFVRLFACLAGLMALCCTGSGLTKEQLQALETRAESGDVEAARQLADYYDTVELPLSPQEYKQLSEKSDLSSREAKKLDEYRKIEENCLKWKMRAEELENPGIPQQAFSREDLKKLSEGFVSILKQEKDKGQLDEAPYVAFLVDSLGFSQNRNVFSRGEGFRFLLLQDGLLLDDWSRQVTVEADSQDALWMLVVALQERGLKHVEGEGTCLKGDGLTVFVDKDRLIIGY